MAIDKKTAKQIAKKAALEIYKALVNAPAKKFASNGKIGYGVDIKDVAKIAATNAYRVIVAQSAPQVELEFGGSQERQRPAEAPATNLAPANPGAVMRKLDTLQGGKVITKYPNVQAMLTPGGKPDPNALRQEIVLVMADPNLGLDASDKALLQNWYKPFARA